MDINSLVPSLIEFYPKLETEGVGVRPEIWARFTTDIDSTQVDSDVELNQYAFLFEEGTGTKISLVFVRYQDRKLVFQPASDLSPGNRYQVTLLSGIRTPFMREMGRNRSWVFKVGATKVAQVQLLEPGDQTAEENGPYLDWLPVSVASTGTVQYHVEIDVSPEFATVNTLGWSTLTSATSAVPASLAVNKSYFWRVTARVVEATGTTIGEPSEVWNFFLGSFRTVAEDQQATLFPSTSFEVDYTEWEDGLSHQSAWPPLVIHFTQAPDPATVTSTTVYLRREAVDGQPGVASATVSASLALSGKILTIVPEEALRNNTRYTVVLTVGVQSSSGEALAAAWESYFTSTYSPFYLGALMLRAALGEFAIGVSDDFLNVHIYRASLDVNRLYYWSFPEEVRAQGGISESVVRTFIFTLTYDMERWVECEAAIRVLRAKLAYISARTGRSRRLGDFQESIDSSSIESLRAAIKEWQQEQEKWAAAFSHKRARPTSAVKSSHWPRWLEDYDLSARGRGRKKI